MGNRRASAETAYPFVPAFAGNAYIAGIKDLFFVVAGGRMDPEPAVDHSHRDEYVTLKSVVSSPASNTYLFYAVSPDGVRQFSFPVPRDLGIVRVPCAGTATAHMIVDSSRMFASPGTFVMPGVVEVEPAQVCWRLTEIRRITLARECRHHDPSQRAGLPPDRVVLVLEADRPDVNTLKLRDGWNCAVTYDEAPGTLTLDGGPGLGRGLPETIFWDSDPPDFNTGVLSINGLADTGGNPTTNNVNIRPGRSVILTQTAASDLPPRLTFTVKEETDA